MKDYYNYFFKLVFLISLIGCRKDLDKPLWEADVLVPVLKTTLGVKDILSDTTYTLGKDSSIVLVYNNDLDSFSLNVIDTLSVPAYHNSFGLTSVTFPQNTIAKDITLGQLARQLAISSDTATMLAGIILLNNQGNRIGINSRDSLSAGPYLVDATDLFQSAVIKSGYLEIKISNKLPVALNEVVLQIGNQSDVVPFLNNDFIAILPGQEQVQQVDLANKTLEGSLKVNAPLISIGGGKNLLIDTNAAVNIEITLHDIKFSSATAFFPAQNIIKDQEEVVLNNLPGGLELKAARFNTAKVRIQIYSTIPERLYFTYNLPNAISPSGNPFSITGSVIAVSTGGPAYDQQFDFSGYTLDLSGSPGHNIVNAFYSDLTGGIRQSTSAIALSDQDSLSITITMSNIRPDYIRGYIQKDTSIRGNIPFDFFKTFKGAALDFDSVDVSLSIKNSFGIAGKITTDYLYSSNKSGQQEYLIDNSLIGVPKTIFPATDNPFKATETVIGTDKASGLLSKFPTNFSYQFSLKAGDNTVPHIYTDFAYNFSVIKPSLNISIPLKFKASGISLSDTVPITPEFSKSIRQGKINLISYNGFPFRGLLKLYFLNSNGSAVDSLITADYIKEGSLEAGSAKVKRKEMSKIQYSFDENRIKRIELADRIVFNITLDTRPLNTAVKIFPDYEIDFKIVGDVVYRVE